MFYGQRNGDLRKMEWSDYDGDWLHVKQEKTGAEVNLPVHKLQLLKQVLDIQPKVGPTIFTSPRGKPWAAANLHIAMDPYRKKAEADDLHWHDLRGTLVSMLAEAGCSENSDCSQHRTLCNTEKCRWKFEHGAKPGRRG